MISNYFKHFPNILFQLNEDGFDASLFSGRKVNLNHLLNFNYDHPSGAGGLERPTYHQSYGRNGNRRQGYTSRVHYNKEKFLQAK